MTGKGSILHQTCLVHTFVLTIASHSLREALYNRLAWIALAVLILAFLLVEFIGALAITEHRVIQATVLGSLLRIASVFMLVLFVVSSLLREQQERSLEVVLSLPWARSTYVLGKALAYGAISLLVSVVCGLALLAYTEWLPALFWSLSLACELVLAGAFGILLAFTFRQTVAAVAAFVVTYLLARAMGALQLMMEQPIFAAHGWSQEVIELFLKGLAWLLPALYRFTNAGWLAEAGPLPVDLLYVFGQTLVYLPLLLAAAAVDLYRREF